MMIYPNTSLKGLSSRIVDKCFTIVIHVLDIRALNYEQQANNFNNQANLDILKGQNAATAGKINAISAGFKGLSSSMNTLAGGFGNGFGGSLGGGKQKIYSVNSFNNKYKNTYAMADLA